MVDEKNVYLGLDIGTDSVGWAVTDDKYNLLRFHGADAWGSVIFEAASLSDERRGFRSARRRLDRRQQRVQLVREIFAEEISKIDPRFFIRLDESFRWRDETEDEHIFFNDEGYTDAEYMKQYPTIHHLICELMNNKDAHDVRLVYLACAWLVAHRGHFLNNININKLDEITDIKAVYDNFMSFFADNGYRSPWGNIDVDAFASALKKKEGVTAKVKNLITILLDGKKPEKTVNDEFPYSQDSIIRLLAGGTCQVKDIFGKEEYADFGSVSLGMEEEKFAELMSNIGDDYDIVAELRAVYDWSVLADILDNKAGISTISASKVAVYDQHKQDLKTLKYFVRNYKPESYDEVFREAKADNYVAYSYNVADSIKSDVKKKANVEDFSKYISKIINSIKPDECDEEEYSDMTRRLELRTFLPKQKNTDNRVIPRQLYEYELKKILENAQVYLPFLKEVSDGTSGIDKIISIFEFKVPYYVGPLNRGSEHAWLERKAGMITPWNFAEMVDGDASEESFIKKMTNKCSYLPGEDVLPKDSLCYQKFMVLNEINNLKIDGRKVSPEIKQGIYKELFEKKKKVRKKDIEEYLISNGYIDKNALESISGIDIQIHSSLSSYLSFKKLLMSGQLSENDVERIIERASYAEDKSRVSKWLRKQYPNLPEEDIKYICKIKVKDFGRLSRKLLMELEGADKRIGEITTILKTMWDTNDNLMEVLSDKYTFAEDIAAYAEKYYLSSGQKLKERLDDMYISNAVRRPIYRTLAIVKDVEKAFGKPSKIFIEMTRGGKEEQKGKRTKSRQQQILDFYTKCKDEDVRDLKHQLEGMGEYVDNRLQSDRLFLYFMQFGRCAYSGEPIVLEKLMAGSKEYDVDHIYPQAYVQDDSVINNKVLVKSEINGSKSDVYPIQSAIRNRMHSQWAWWNQVGTLSNEKYKRLTRSTPFTADEKYGFINRQLTETSQSTKAVAGFLKERFPEAEIVYTKAGLASDFRHEFDLPKSRVYNDLHHAVDAYLNVVAGNVYHMRFTRRWFNVDMPYSIKVKTLFTHPVKCGHAEVWNGTQMLEKVKKTARKNTAHFVKYAKFKTGGLFDQMPVKRADEKADALVPLKKGLSPARYGGYNKPGAMFFIPVRYKAGKKSEIFIMSVELMHGKHFLEDTKFAKEYAFDRMSRILGKTVSDITFPMGMRPWKVNTVLSLDGFRVCIAGISGGGTRLIAQPIMQFSSDCEWKGYLKKIERFVEKNKNNSNLIYDEEHDKVSAEKNQQLYDLYTDKLQNSTYKKRINAPKEILINGKERFSRLEILQQCQVLLNIHAVFGRLSAGTDLTLIGGSAHSAATVISSSIPNWKKNYTDVRIIDQSPSGMWEKQSQNLLELL